MRERRVKVWWQRDYTPWWRFWHPGSGFVGGMIFAIIGGLIYSGIILVLTMWLYR